MLGQHNMLVKECTAETSWLNGLAPMRFLRPLRVHVKVMANMGTG